MYLHSVTDIYAVLNWTRVLCHICKRKPQFKRYIHWRYKFTAATSHFWL